MKYDIFSTRHMLLFIYLIISLKLIFFFFKIFLEKDLKVYSFFFKWINYSLLKNKLEKIKVLFFIKFKLNFIQTCITLFIGYLMMRSSIILSLKSYLQIDQ